MTKQNFWLRFSRLILILYRHIIRNRWMRLLINSGNEFRRDNAGDMAAAMAYYGILSIFPLLLGIIAIMGYFLPSEIAQEQFFSILNKYLPVPTDIIQNNITDIIKIRGTLSILSLIGLFWSGSAIFEVIGRSINIAWDVRGVPFYIRKLRNIIISVLTSFMFLIALGLAAVTVFFSSSQLPGGSTFALLLTQLLPFILIFGLILLIYKYFPNTKIAWGDIWLGSLLTAIFFEIARRGFLFYLQKFANFQLVYGSVASIIVFLLWVYVLSLILLFGAEFSSEYSKMRHPGKVIR